jgi:ribonucleoside-diphosphate reductase alpha chain
MTGYSYSQVLEATVEYFSGDELAAKVFVDKYALQDLNGTFLEKTPADMHRRLAKEFARIEAKYPNPMSEDEIFALLDHYRFIVPQGSPMFGIGNEHYVQSLGNCFVVESPYDSYGGILKTDQEMAQLMKRRAGVGTDIANIRPKGLATKNAAKTTDGIAIFMDRFSNTCREVAQCLGANTLILTINGLKPISEIKIGDEVWTKNKWVPVEKVLKNKKKVINLTTLSGKTITASKDHIIHTMSGEKIIKSLNKGNQITEIVGEGWQGNEIKLSSFKYKKLGLNQSNRLKADIILPTILDEKLAYLLGQMYGDGCIEQKNELDTSICIALSDDWKDITTKCVFIANDIFNVKLSVKQKANEQCSRGRLSSREIIEFLRQNNLLKQKADKIDFPKQLFSATKSVLFSFISGYFDADGCVQVSKKQYKMSSIKGSFLSDIQCVLSAFGMTSKIHKQIRNNKSGQENWQDLYELTINGEKNQDLFRTLMTESIKVSSCHFVAKKRDFTRTIYKIGDFNSVSSRHTYIIDNNQYLSYSTADRLKNDLNNKMNTFLLQDFIASISEESEIEEDVYDLVLPREHLFYANGLYVHNSGRRGALMLSNHINHPEIDTFINIKQDNKRITGANISVRITNKFMNAVRDNEDFTLQWPVDTKNPVITKKIKAKDIWDQIIHCAWTSAEPGVLFWDHIIDNSPADIYAEKYPNFKTQSTNPCGELPLGLDSCRLLVVNLLSFVTNPFTKKAKFDFELYSSVCQKAQRLMDDLVDLEIEKIERLIRKIEADPEPAAVKAIELNMWKQFLQSCIMGRRTGTGITALGDCLAALGIKYGSKSSIEMTDEIYRQLMINTYKSSFIMAGERGAFPIFDASLEKKHPFISHVLSQSKELEKLYKTRGRRNIALLTTAPTGSVSTQTQTSSGIEPVYMLSYVRRKKHNPSDKNARIDFVDAMGDCWQEFTVYHHGVKRWMDVTGETDITKSPYYGATSNDIDWMASVDLQAAAQKHIDHSISKTCNLPETATKELVSQVYMRAWEKGCKGFTVYRDKCRDGVLINTSEAKKTIDNRPAQIEISEAPKRPIILPCEIKKVKISGETWTIFVGLFNDKPYEIFGGLSKYVDIPNKFKMGKIIKNGKVDDITTYNLILGEGDDQMLVKDIANVFENGNFGAFTRTISLALRHGTPIQYIVEQLQKDKHSDITSFSKVIARVLKNYIMDGTKSTAERKCPNCNNSRLIYQQGCMQCVGGTMPDGTICTWSKC